MGIENSEIAIITANSFIFLLPFYFTTMVEWLRCVCCVFEFFCSYNQKSYSIVLLKGFKNGNECIEYILIVFSHFDPFCSIKHNQKFNQRFNTHTLHIIRLYNYLNTP